MKKQSYVSVTAVLQPLNLLRVKHKLLLDVAACWVVLSVSLPVALSHLSESDVLWRRAPPYASLPAHQTATGGNGASCKNKAIRCLCGRDNVPFTACHSDGRCEIDSNVIPLSFAAWNMAPSTSKLTALVHSSSNAYRGLDRRKGLSSLLLPWGPCLPPLSTCLSVSLAVCLVRLSMHSSNCVCLSVHLSFGLTVCICLSLCLSVYCYVSRSTCDRKSGPSQVFASPLQTEHRASHWQHPILWKPNTAKLLTLENSSTDY